VLGIYDVLLPCRLYTIDHKVTEVGRVSLTAEFLLRLLKSVDGMNESDVAAFFGFDHRDMSFVLNEVDTHGYVDRKDGKLWLTAVGQALFRDASPYPEIYEIEERRETVAFDLIALAPQERGSLELFELRLPELKLRDPDIASSATTRIPKAFRIFYPEIVSRRDPAAAAKRSLYSVDDVTPKDRFSSVVRISVVCRAARPSAAEPDLSDWRSDHERDDRAAVTESAARFVESLNVSRRADDRDAYQLLFDIAPEYLKDFARRDGFSVDRYFREALTREGDVRIDRPTVSIVGSLLTRDNSRRLFDIADYGLRQALRPPTCLLWLPPQLPCWGATSALPAFLGQIRTRVGALTGVATQETDIQIVALVAGRPPKYIEAAFDRVASTDSTRIPPALELLVIPRTLAAVVVHTPIGASNGAAVPIGIASFDARVVSRVHAAVADHFSSFNLPYDLAQGFVAELADVPKPPADGDATG
jgi:hypothetical protein